MRPYARNKRFDDGVAFVPDVGESHTRLADEDAEWFGEEFVAAAISGEGPFEEHPEREEGIER